MSCIPIVVVVIVVVIVEVVVDVHDGINGQEDEGKEGECIESRLRGATCRSSCSK